MSGRREERPDLGGGKRERKRNQDVAPEKDEEAGVRFEDPFSDEEEEDDEMEVMDAAEDEEMMDEDEEDSNYQVYVPGKDGNNDQELEVDNSAYEMLHRMTVEWPMLSFDFVPDNLGQQRTRFPLTAYAVGGTEAESGTTNKLILMKMSQLHRTKHDDDDSNSDASDDNEDDLDDDPELQHVQVKHNGSVNRIRTMPQEPGVCVSWSGEAKVHIWDLRPQLKNLENNSNQPASNDVAPVFTFAKHKDEGFAMDWSKVVAGQLATGDCNNLIYRCNRADGVTWVADEQPYKGHSASVEDIQWSPTEAEVMASCSVDKTVRIWDGRRKGGSALHVEAAECDINVISWNTKVPYLLASGDDMGNFRVWDLRSFQAGKPVASFTWHTQAITSIEWCPDQPSVIAASAADNQVTLWDMSLERDAEAEAQMIAQGIPVPEVPPQLIFIHQGQKEIKEIHWHPQCPGVIGSTASDGFHIFKTINS